MKVILIKDVKKIGKAGVVLDVSEGYARNFLIPRRLAVLATADAVKSKQEDTARKNAKLESRAIAAKALLERISSRTYRFSVSGDKTGHLYAGLKESEILAKITEGEATLHESLELVDYSPIKTAGEHEVKVKTGANVKKIKITITAANG